VDLGDFRRERPVSRLFGLDRGHPIDRLYIEQFLQANSDAIRGHVLEIGDDVYTRKYGGARVHRSDVLHVAAGSGVTIVGDLTRSDGVPDGTFDCVIVTQTLQFIYDVQAAVQNLERVLTPGGVVLATVPGITQISRYDMDRWGEYWRFTSLAVRKLFEERFTPEQVRVTPYGNVLAAISFLEGLAVEDLSNAELDLLDADYEVIVGVRASKSRV
jgi:SAM-dependent methyltransferase